MPVPVLPDLPRFPLLDGPSPLHPAPRFAAALGGGFDLWLKREDLLPLAFGGNKLRNLEYLVGEAIAAGADCLITAGRRWSNHCRLTAAAGARAGLQVHLVLSGPPRKDEGPSTRIERLLGATVHQLGTADRAEREGTIDRLVRELQAAGERPHLVPVGGSSVTGAFGQVVAGVELAAQVASWPAPPDLVVLASATGGTQAGLLVGLRASGLPTRVVGVVVARPITELQPSIDATVHDLSTLVGITPLGDRIELDDTCLGGGYGVPSPDADAAAGLLARSEAVLADPIYTAKSVAWLVAAARAGQLAGRRVVFWHAGGTPGLFEPLEEGE